MGHRHNHLTAADIQERISRATFHRMYSPEVLDVDNDAMTLRLRVTMCDTFERQPGTGHWHGCARGSAAQPPGERAAAAGADGWRRALGAIP